jgi:hypothetical protein
MIKSLAELLSSNIIKDYHKETHKSTVLKPAGNKQTQLYNSAKKRYAFNPAEQVGTVDNYTFNKLSPAQQKVWGALCTLAKTVEITQQGSPRAYEFADKIWLSAKSETIAERAGVSIRTYFDAINHFIELGWLERHKCNNTNGRKNKFAPVFFKITLSPSAIKKTMMLLTSFLQLLSFTNPSHTDTKLYSNIYINKTLNIVSKETKTDTFVYAKSFNAPFIKKGGGGEAKMIINQVLEQLYQTVSSNLTMNELRSQVRTLLVKHFKTDDVDHRVVEQATKRAANYINQRRSEERLRKTREYMANRPFGVMKPLADIPNANKIEAQHNNNGADMVLYCLINKIAITPEIIDTYTKINDIAQRELFKKGLLDEENLRRRI